MRIKGLLALLVSGWILASSILGVVYADEEEIVYLPLILRFSDATQVVTSTSTPTLTTTSVPSTNTSTATASVTATPTNTSTAKQTETVTPTSTPVIIIVVVTATPSETPIPSVTPTPTQTGTSTPSVTPIVITVVVTATPSETPTPSITPTPSTTPTPTYTPIPPSIVNLHETTESPFTVLWGEVNNSLEAPIYSVAVLADIFDGESWITTSRSWISPFFVLPNTTNCFAIEFCKDCWTHYDLRLQYQNTSLDVQPLLVEGIQVSEENSSIKIQGQIRNNQDRTMNLGWVHTTFYDADGKVIDCVQELLSTHIQVDQTVHFQLTSSRAYLYKDVYTYRIQAPAYPVLN